MRKALILVMIIILSCNGNKGPIYPNEWEYHTGKKGLEFGFVANAPPKSVYENSDFMVSAQTTNKGAFDITDGIMLLGFETDYMELRGALNRVNFNLKGRSLLFPDGEISILNFPAKSRELDPQSMLHTLDLLLITCYNYRTEIIENVCIDMDQGKINKGDVTCTEKTFDYQKGQGAPIAITRLETDTLSGDANTVRPQFKLYVQNAGSGNPINRYKINDICATAGTSGRDFNMVFLTMLSVSNERFKYDFNGLDSRTNKERDQELGGNDNIICKPNPLILDPEVPENNFFSCLVEAMPAEQSSYKTQFYAVLDYGYMETKAQKLKVENGEFS